MAMSDKKPPQFRVSDALRRQPYVELWGEEARHPIAAGHWTDEVFTRAVHEAHIRYGLGDPVKFGYEVTKIRRIFAVIEGDGEESRVVEVESTHPLAELCTVGLMN